MTKKLRIVFLLMIVAAACASISAQVNLSAPTASKTIPETFIVPISVNDISALGIVAFEFNVAYNPAVIDPTGTNFGCSTAGTLAGNAGLSATCNVTPDGLLRISVSGVAPMTGSGTLLVLNFKTDPGAFSGNVSPLNFQSVAFFNNAGAVPVTSTNGSITLLVPTAASVSVTGRAVASDGRVIGNAIVTVSDGTDFVRVARTSPFGYYRVEGLAAGGSYIVTATSKQYSFAPRILLTADNVVDFDLVGEN